MSIFQRRYPHEVQRGSNQHDSSSEDEMDEISKIQREEEEQERILSEQHGEAAESSSSGSKRSRTVGGVDETDADIAKTLNGVAAKKKKTRITLTEKELVGSKGIQCIPREFSKRVKYRSLKSAREKKGLYAEIKAAASYTNTLLQSYQTFATKLMPSWSHLDTLTRIQDLGSKREVSSYLKTMRHEVCRDYLIGVYGEEKAIRFMNEFESGLLNHRKHEVQTNGMHDISNDLEDIENELQTNEPNNGNVRPNTKQNKHKHLEEDKYNHSEKMQVDFPNTSGVSRDKPDESDSKSTPSAFRNSETSALDMDEQETLEVIKDREDEGKNDALYDDDSEEELEFDDQHDTADKPNTSIQGSIVKKRNENEDEHTKTFDETLLYDASQIDNTEVNESEEVQSKEITKTVKYLSDDKIDNHKAKENTKTCDESLLYDASQFDYTEKNESRNFDIAEISDKLDSQRSDADKGLESVENAYDMEENVEDESKEQSEESLVLDMSQNYVEEGIGKKYSQNMNKTQDVKAETFPLGQQSQSQSENNLNLSRNLSSIISESQNLDETQTLVLTNSTQLTQLTNGGKDTIGYSQDY
mmetsp:Transcript_11863/g.16851  ORF Transcript_11863/g.16851 Transcript_11863/m.16851 type:complete len:586 (+) Transcript_11863:81-1838(+)